MSLISVMGIAQRTLDFNDRESENGNLLAKPNKQDLAFVKELLESGKVKLVIDRCYSLSQVADAIRYLEEGHAQRKVVITVAHNN